ncbi:MAG: elongation factor P-like protein YeiP [Desulfobacteraceae bacterium]|nr:MAG: elongation factor P-like protein YeiP [Desulfobacteraceae bacterium]
MKASQLRKGHVISINATAYRVRDIDMQTPSARGANTLYRVRLSAIGSGQNLEQTFKSNDVLEEVNLERRAITYLYSDHENYHFMDALNYEQYSLSADQLEEQKDWLVENMEGLSALLLDGQLAALELPAAVELDIVETAPVIKGATATNRNKPATLSNGRVVQVPDYMGAGDRVRINTETGKFMARVR